MCVNETECLHKVNVLFCFSFGFSFGEIFMQMHFKILNLFTYSWESRPVPMSLKNNACMKNKKTKNLTNNEAMKFEIVKSVSGYFHKILVSLQAARGCLLAWSMNYPLEIRLNWTNVKQMERQPEHRTNMKKKTDTPTPNR